MSSETLPGPVALPLPVELIRYIMELAANASPSAAAALASVSSIVNGWMTVILYRAVILLETNEVELFHRSVQLDKSNAVEHTRFLSLNKCRRTRAVNPEILSRCTRLERLVLGVWVNWRDSIIACPTPWEVVLLGYGYPWNASMNKPLRNVTHFFYSTYCFDFEQKIRVCQALPCLTHFGYMCAPGYRDVNDHRDNSTVPLTKSLLASNASLGMVLLHAFSPSLEPATEFPPDTWTGIVEIGDERLLLRPGLADGEFSELLKTGETMWDNAKKRFGNWRDILKHGQAFD